MRELNTERLLLRASREADAEEMMEMRNSVFVMKDNVMQPVDKERMLRLIRAEAERGNTWYIERKEDGALLGTVSAEEDNVRFGIRSKCLSYYLGEPQARQGYMREALWAVLHELFIEWNLEVVSARVLTGNVGSERLLKSLGFVYEGCIRRCVRTPKHLIRDDMQFFFAAGRVFRRL